MWVCSNCTFENDAAVDTCICGSLKAVASLDMKTQWSCEVCTCVNMAVQFSCEACGSPKPMASVKPSPPASPTPTPGGGLDEKQPALLANDHGFLSALHAYSGSYDIHAHTLSGMERVMGVPWRALSAAPLASEWKQAAQAALIGVCAEKVRNAQRLLGALIHAATEEERQLSRRECLKCRVSGADTVLFVNPECKEPHPVCVPCTRQHVLVTMCRLGAIGSEEKDKDRQKEDGRCLCLQAGCPAELPPAQIRRCLNQKQYDAYLNATTRAFIQQEDVMVTCPDPKCGAVMEVLKNKSDASHNSSSNGNGNNKEDDVEMTDDLGKPLSAAATQHYRQNRVRCRECQCVFCAQCKERPYHLGFTCSEAAVDREAQHCRFCSSQLTPANTPKHDPKLPALSGVCTAAECQEKRAKACGVVLKCAHPCAGVRDEKKHPPCLDPACAADSKQGQDASEFCNICWVEELGQAPVLQLDCGHMFHRQCILNQIDKRWPGTRITFGFLECPLCKIQISHPSLKQTLAPLLSLFASLKDKAMKRLQVENMLKDPKLTDPSSRYYKRPEQYAMDCFAYYNCFKCKNAYFGGRRDCEQNAAAENRPPEEFICYDCSPMKNIHCKVPAHQEYHVWKCRFCCSTAVWFCFGTTHYCEPCHRDNPMEKVRRARSGFKQCPGPVSCPIKGNHAPNGAEAECEHSLGCGLCMDASREIGKK